MSYHNRNDDNDSYHSGRQNEYGSGNNRGRDEGNVETGGYGRESQQHHSSGRNQGRDEYGGARRDDYESTTFDQPAHNYNQSQQHGSSRREEGGRDHQGRHQEEGYGMGGGRSAVGQGETYVGLGHRGGDETRRTTDAYGGEGFTQGESYGRGSNTNTHSGGGYSSMESNAGSGHGNYGSSHTRNPGSGHSGSNYNSGNTSSNYNSANTGSNYSSNNTGSNHDSSNTTKGTGGVYVAGSDEKWKPGQEMSFPAAEAEAEKNPFVDQATGYAGDTQNAVKQGIKDAEQWAFSKAKEMLGGNKK